MASLVTTCPGSAIDCSRGGEIGRVADDSLLQRRTFTNKIADNDKAGCYTHARRKRLMRGRTLTPDHRRNPEPRMHGALGFIFMRLGPAEIGQHAITHIFGNIATGAFDFRRHRVLVRCDHHPHVFRVEAS